MWEDVMKITIKQVLAFGPCYDETALLKMSGGRRKMDVAEIFCLRTVSVEDKIWLGIKLMTEKQQRKFACDCALDVIDRWDAPEVVVRYLKTQDESIREAARSAAYSAAYSAADSAAYWTASSTASRASSWAVADSAAADWAAYWAVYWAARRKQLRRIKRVLMKRK